MSLALAIAIVSVTGLIGGAVLVLAAQFMYVPEDERIPKVAEALPGANCGACGFAGCNDYAKAIVEGITENISLCTPGGNAAATAIGVVMEMTASEVLARKAIVICQGSYDNTKDKYEYNGIKSCSACTMLFGGRAACMYGCLGFGDCKVKCKFDAIIVQNGIATIDLEKCTGCGACVAACPKKIIELYNVTDKPVVMCMNKDKGALTRKDCTAGCIGCMKCTKVCEYAAITVTDNNANINSELCTGCGKCVENCPVKCIVTPR